MRTYVILKIHLEVAIYITSLSYARVLSRKVHKKVLKNVAESKFSNQR